MKNITLIFKDDVKGICRHFFALVVAIGIIILPALYAWFNIYSNGDPYGNTAGMKLAAVSLDQGYKKDDGTFENMGEDVMKDLAKSDAITWEFVDTEEEALKGVESGKYYAAIVVQKDFTYNMYNVFLEDVDRPQIKFYQNQKKNPVANKITDTVMGNVKNKINKQFIKIVTETVFEDANSLSDDIEERGGVDAIIDDLKEVNDELIDYEDTINRVIKSNSILTAAIAEANNDAKTMEGKADDAADSLDDAGDKLDSTQVTLNDYSTLVTNTMTTVNALLKDLEEQLKKGQLAADAAAMEAAANQAQADLNQTIADLNALIEGIEAVAGGGGLTPDQQAAIDTIMGMKDQLAQVQTAIDALQALAGSTQPVANGSVSSGMANTEASLLGQVQSAQTTVATAQSQLTNNLIPQMNTCIDSLKVVLDDASSLMSSLSTTMNLMQNVFSSLDTTVNTTNTSLQNTADAIGQISERLTKIIEKTEKASDDEKVEILMNTLSGNPEMYGEFFSEPVQIETKAVYPVDTYGSSVTPFYTVLALWVGIIILCAVIKVHPDEAKYEGATPTELFLGRYVIFFVMGQLQATVTMIGNIAIFHSQCVNPFLFWLACSITSTVFSMFIYSLVYSFGDVGKAASVVIVVLQIAGSSGTYPIELLPEFFQKMYIFFPFPYAINAIRETVAGLYEMDYVIYLLELSSFFAVGLVIGLLIRIPFEGINEYMEERMEDTEMM